MNKYINKFDKFLYWMTYRVIIDNPKPYEKITRAVMVDEIRDYFRNNLSDVHQVITYEALEFLRSNITVSDILPYYKYIADIMFLLETNDGETFTILPEFADTIANIELNESLKEREEFKDIIRGMLAVYGGMRFTDVDRVYKKIRDPKYASFKIPTVESFLFLKDELADMEYDVYIDGAFHPIFQASNQELFLSSVDKIYPLEFYKELKHNSLNRKDSDYIISKLNRDYLTAREIIEFIPIYLNTTDNIMVVLKAATKGDTSLLPPLLVDFIDILLNQPIWNLHGYNYLEYIKTTQNACLEVSKQDSFFTFIDELLLYANNKYRYIKNVKSIAQLHKEVSTDLALKILTESLAKKGFREQFIQSKSYSNTPHITELLESLRATQIINKGYAYKYENDRLLVLAEGKIYHILGISQPINTLLPSILLPALIDTVVFPLYDSITYGISFSQYTIGIGKGVKDIFERDLKNAHHIRSLRTA